MRASGGMGHVCLEGVAVYLTNGQRVIHRGIPLGVAQERPILRACHAPLLQVDERDTLHDGAYLILGRDIQAGGRILFHPPYRFIAGRLLRVAVFVKEVRQPLGYSGCKRHHVCLARLVVAHPIHQDLMRQLLAVLGGQGHRVLAAPLPCSPPFLHGAY